MRLAIIRVWRVNYLLNPLSNKPSLQPIEQMTQGMQQHRIPINVINTIKLKQPATGIAVAAFMWVAMVG